MNNKYTSNLAFVDLLFNLLAGFVTLFIIAFLLIKPAKDNGVVDPKVEFFVLIEWDEKSRSDIDLWIQAPTGEVVAYNQREGSFFALSRDDLGTKNDTVIVNGEPVEIHRNQEDVQIRAIVPGRYVVNVHHFQAPRNSTQEEDVQVKLLDTSPYREVVSVEVSSLRLNAEKTAFVFWVDEDGSVSEVDTEVQVKVRGGAGARWSSAGYSPNGGPSTPSPNL